MNAWLPADLVLLEIAALSLMLDNPGEPFATIRQQLAVGTVAERTLTGAGFYRDFLIPPDAAVPRDLVDCEIGWATANHPELAHGAGFALFIREGVVSFLEGFTYGIADWPEDEAAFTFVEA